MTQQEITWPTPLLDKNGCITREGWSRKPYWSYDRRSIKAPWFRIKEWDYYYVLSDDGRRGITFTFSDLGYAGLMALCWLDFDAGTATQVDSLAALPGGKLFSDPDELKFVDRRLSLRFQSMPGRRVIHFSAPVFRCPDGRRGLSGELVLTNPNHDSLNIATSWKENRRRFYYNRKITAMPAEGRVNVGGEEFHFRSDRDFGGLDWGRGAWTYRNRWYWSSAGGLLDGVPFGFNLGYGFSDRSPASENTLFYDGVAHKLGDVFFHFDHQDYTRKWTFQDDQGRLELEFEPIVDRSSAVDLLVITSRQHQVFGRFSGKVVLDDGRELVLNRFLGFAEDVFNRW